MQPENQPEATPDEPSAEFAVAPEKLVNTAERISEAHPPEPASITPHKHADFAAAEAASSQESQDSDDGAFRISLEVPGIPRFMLCFRKARFKSLRQFIHFICVKTGLDRKFGLPSESAGKNSLAQEQAAQSSEQDKVKREKYLLFLEDSLLLNMTSLRDGDRLTLVPTSLIGDQLSSYRRKSSHSFLKDVVNARQIFGDTLQRLVEPLSSTDYGFSKDAMSRLTQRLMERENRGSRLRDYDREAEACSSEAMKQQKSTKDIVRDSYDKIISNNSLPVEPQFQPVRFPY
jgi:hypothetical protein